MIHLHSDRSEKSDAGMSQDTDFRGHMDHLGISGLKYLYFRTTNADFGGLQEATLNFRKRLIGMRFQEVAIRKSLHYGPQLDECLRELVLEEESRRHSSNNDHR